MRNVPPNSHLSFRALVSLETVFKLNPEHARKQMNSWAYGNINYTYLLLRQNCNVNDLEKNSRRTLRNRQKRNCASSVEASNIFSSR